MYISVNGIAKLFYNGSSYNWKLQHGLNDPSISILNSYQHKFIDNYLYLYLNTTNKQSTNDNVFSEIKISGDITGKTIVVKYEIDTFSSTPDNYLSGIIQTFTSSGVINRYSLLKETSEISTKSFTIGNDVSWVCVSVISGKYGTHEIGMKVYSITIDGEEIL